MSRPSPAGSRLGHSPSTPTVPTTTIHAEPPDPPDTLGSHGAALWTEIWRAGAGVYQPSTDRWTILRYCEIADRRRHLIDLVQAEGWLSVGSTGQTVTHPAARMVMDLERMMSSHEDRLGLNPEARARLGITLVESQSRLDRFISESGDA
jgi:P27 family predicted phage terminase small subunit